MKASIITIGDEILIGQIVDTNSAWIARQLRVIGIDIHHIHSVSDTREGILAGLQLASDSSDVIIVTGGLGPTKDDITKSVLAEYTGDSLEFNSYNFEIIKEMIEKRGRQLTEGHKQQCYLPSKATLLENKMGTAPGMVMRKNGKMIISLPGVPYEMKYIISHSVIDLLKDQSGINIIHKTIRTAGHGESMISDKINDIVEDIPSHIKMAYLPSIGQVRLRLSGRGIEKKIIEKEIDQIANNISERLGSMVFGFDDDILPKVLGDMCKEKNLQMALAESCTGGYISSLITSVPGASAYFQGGVVSYANKVKINTLKVSKQTLDDHGAVSQKTVEEMLLGVLDLTKADIGAAVSGIAGPGGGTVEKPVGTIWIAYGSKDKLNSVKLELWNDRKKNIEYTGITVLNMLRKFLMSYK